MKIETKEEAKAHIEDIKGFMTFYDAERIMNGETTPEDVLNEEKVSQTSNEDTKEQMVTMKCSHCDNESREPYDLCDECMQKEIDENKAKIEGKMDKKHLILLHKHQIDNASRMFNHGEISEECFMENKAIHKNAIESLEKGARNGS